jgi:hypothetical protein
MATVSMVEVTATSASAAGPQGEAQGSQVHDVAAADVAQVTLDEHESFMLFYWDARNGDGWQGWWVMPERHFGFPPEDVYLPSETSDMAFGRGAALTPAECPGWVGGSGPVRMCVLPLTHPDGADAVKEDGTTDSWLVFSAGHAYEGAFEPCKSSHDHSGRAVHKRTRALRPEEVTGLLRLSQGDSTPEFAPELASIGTVQAAARASAASYGADGSPVDDDEQNEGCCGDCVVL